MDEEPIPRDFSELTPEEKEQVRIHLTEAIHGRIRQWNAELKVEELLGQEIEVPIADYAACMELDEELSIEEAEEVLDGCLLGNRPIRIDNP